MTEPKGSADSSTRLKPWAFSAIPVNPSPTARCISAFAHDSSSGEFWAIVTDEVPTLQVFQQYAWHFQVEENFLDLKSNAFDLEASRLRDKDAPQSIMWGDCVDHAVSNATRN